MKVKLMVGQNMTENYCIANPKPASMIESLRSIGYVLPTVIADINDIALWGTNTRKLSEVPQSASRSLAGYAAGGLTRQPSLKQARRGADMIEIARQLKK